MTEGRGAMFADAIARAIGGSAERLATERDVRLVRLADGRAPVLVRDLGHVLRVCVDGGIARSCRAGEPFDALVTEISGAAETWRRSKKSAGRLTLFAAVAEATALLSDAFDDRWLASFPGTPLPAEAWLHGSNVDAASVGIVRGRLSIQLDSELRLLPASTPDEWQAARDALLDGVRLQLASHRQNVSASTRLGALAQALRGRLAEQLGLEAVLRQAMRPTHFAGSRLTIERGARLLVELDVIDGVPTVIAGARGADGWRGEATSLDAVWPPVLAAVQRSLELLVLSSLVPTVRYRVLAPIGDLKQGAVVTFRGFVDVDNHYGSYDFEDSSGTKVSVTGDFSRPERHPFAETHRYLELVAR